MNEASRAEHRPPSLFALVFLAVICHTAFTASRMTVSLAAIGLQAPTFLVGMLLSVYGLLPMMLSVAFGRWIDRTGTRVPMLLGSIALAFGYAIPTLWLSLPSLFFCAVLVGVGFLPFHMSIQKLTGELDDGPERMRNFGWLAVGFSVSGFLGPIIAGYLIDHAGAGASFGASFSASTVLILVAFVLLKWKWTFSGRTMFDHGEHDGQRKVFDLLRAPSLRRLFVTVVLVSTAWDVLMFLMPIHGSKVGLSASQIGIVLGSFAVATFVVRMGLPILSRFLSEWQMLAIVQITAAVVYLTLPLVGSHYGLIALVFVLGLGLGIGQPAIMTLLHQQTPPGRVGEAVGLRMTVINATQTVLPTVFGSVGSVLALFLPGALTFAPLFWGVALMVGAGGVSVWRAGASAFEPPESAARPAPASRPSGDPS